MLRTYMTMSYMSVATSGATFEVTLAVTRELPNIHTHDTHGTTAQNAPVITSTVTVGIWWNFHFTITLKTQIQGEKKHPIEALICP